jgi:hypothetical protein
MFRNAIVLASISGAGAFEIYQNTPAARGAEQTLQGTINSQRLRREMEQANPQTFGNGGQVERSPLCNCDEKYSWCRHAKQDPGLGC